MSSPLQYVTLLLLVTGKSGAQSVSQSPEKLLVLEGRPLFINCTYEYSGNPYLFWYFQPPGEAPQMMLNAYGQKEYRGFSAPHNKTKMSFHLRKESSEVGDSGLYLCALRDGGSGRKMFFGDGTRLTVKPDLRNSPPSVYRLKPANGSENQMGSACLITDFFPSDQVKVFINNKEGQRPPTLVESRKRWSYGVVEWSNDSHGQPVNCAASYQARNNYTYEDKDDVQKSCPVMSVDESFQTDEKLNTLSLTVLGLKIIFMKSIAFNILMTLKLWTR